MPFSKNALLLVSLGVWIGSESLGASFPDPYAAVRSERLHNGIKVVLAPSPDAATVQFKIRVRAGLYNEAKGKEGVAHLLEHYLFTDAKLERDMTYLEVFKEKGGSANAYTSTDETVYYATVPAALASWAADVFSRMLLGRTFDEAQVEHAKGPVYLEIGRPSVFDYLLEIGQMLWPDFARIPSIWESEFGVKWPDRKWVAHKINTDGFVAADIREFYNAYYHPGNVTVFVAGKFQDQEMLSLLEGKIGSDASHGLPGWDDPTPVPIRRPYDRTQVSDEVPRIEIGTKVANATFSDEVIGRIYIEYLSHRLMKDLRNEKGETYTVIPHTDIRRGSGTLTVQFEAPRDTYRKNLNAIRAMIDGETRHGGTTPALFQAAKDLYLKGFEHADRDSGTMMGYAARWDWVERNFPERRKDITDFSAARDLKYQTYVDRLLTLFAPDMGLENLKEPPFFFRYESLLLLVAAFSIWMAVFGKIMVRPFDHGGIRWVRNFSYPPAYLLQLGALAGVVVVAGILTLGLDRIWMGVHMFQKSVLLSDYLRQVVSVGIGLLTAQGIFAICARKAMVVGDALWIKSLGYWSWNFPLAEIKSVEVRSPLALLLSPRLLWKVKYRFCFYDLRLLKSGLLVHRAGGRSYFFGLTASEHAALELRHKLPTLREAVSRETPDAKISRLTPTESETAKAAP